MGIFSSKSRQGAAPEAKRNIDTVIGADAVFEGNLHIKNSVCIEGTLRGKLRCEGRVILNSSGVLEADVSAEYLSVNGRVLGNVKAGKQLDVGETGVIEGDVEAASITVAKGGVLRGSCRMAEALPQEAPAPLLKNPARAAAANPAPARKGPPEIAPELAVP
ncbi:MAG: polymer-forming cytoskeletal protein [Deferrisomatales bacterium]|nr:polymer-forming cytoskeletal protein [Deferrisomatales bacterium]